MWLFLPSLLLIASHFLVPDFTARYLSMCAPGAALVLATVIVRLARRPLLPAAVALALVAAAGPSWIQQRGPYAKNDSDWSQISATLAHRAHAGDAVAFDESVRPSRRTRLAMRTYPAGFAGLADPTIHIPYYDNTTWYDRDYTIAQAIALGRFDGVHRVWVIEYATAAHADSYGLADLALAGFVTHSVVRGHRSEIVELTR